MDKKIETSKFSHQDEREKIIKVAKKEESSMKLYADAEEVFGTKRWEDDWRRIFIVAGPAGYIGNLVSVTLGVSGGVFLAYQLTSNWASAILIGVIVTFIMEIAKSLSLKESIIHALKGKGVSSMVLGSVAVTMLVASAYFSVESGKETPYFQRWVKAETGEMPKVPLLSETNDRLQVIESDMKSIENERASYEARNPNKTAKWLKADSYERLKAEKEAIQNEQIAAKEGDVATAYAQATDATADSLSWWYWAIVLLSEACVIFGYCFKPYYLYRCRELAIAEGKKMRQEDIGFYSSPTQYHAVQLPVDDDFSKEDLKQQILLLQQQLQQHPHPPTPTNPMSPPINHLRKIGFVNTVDTAKEAVNTVDTAEKVSVMKMPIDSNTPDDILLAAFRASNSSITSRHGRDTEQAKEQIQLHRDRQNNIQKILAERGKKIVLDKSRRAYIIIPIA